MKQIVTIPIYGTYDTTVTFPKGSKILCVVPGFDPRLHVLVDMGKPAISRRLTFLSEYQSSEHIDNAEYIGVMAFNDVICHLFVGPEEE